MKAIIRVRDYPYTFLVNVETYEKDPAYWVRVHPKGKYSLEPNYFRKDGPRILEVYSIEEYPEMFL